MSSKATIILTEDGEHWYNETNSITDGCFDVELQIDAKNIIEIDTSKEYDDAIFITLKGNCELSKYINKLRNIELDK